MVFSRARLDQELKVLVVSRRVTLPSAVVATPKIQRHGSASDRHRTLRICVAFALLLTRVAPGADALGDPPTSWRDEIASGYVPYHRLTMFDYPVNDSVHRENGMYTRAFRRYDYRHELTTRNDCVVARIVEWTVWSGFDRNKSSRKSWFHPIAQTLPHEQGHLDISELFSKRFATTPIAQLPVGQGSTAAEAEADLGRRMKALAVMTAAQSQAEQDRYDAETDHGRNAVKQREWSADIQARLQRAGIHF